MARRCDVCMAKQQQAMSHEPKACHAALRSGFGFLGKRWNGVIIGTLANGPARFSELRRAIDGISDSVLSGRLAELGGGGLVQRLVDEGPPIAVDYRLSPVGAALLPALRELTKWARHNLSAQSS